MHTSIPAFDIQNQGHTDTSIPCGVPQLEMLPFDMSNKMMVTAGAAAVAALLTFKLLAREDELPPVSPGKERFLVYGKNGWIGGKRAF
jgi:hypothetical protein